jgi:hypothetical protein
MRQALRRIARPLGTAAVLGAVFLVAPASAKRLTCADIEAALAGGKSFTAVRDELHTSDARVEVCARIADQRARNNARHESVRAERSARRQRVD